jgi:hypothetical protein
MARTYSRKEFLQIAGITSAELLIDGFITSCRRVTNLTSQIIDASATPKPTNTFESSTPTPTPSPTLAEKIATPKPSPDWIIPGPEKRVQLMANPDFWTKPQGPSQRTILAHDLDDNEYKRLDPKLTDPKTNEFINSNYKGNSCGISLITTSLRNAIYLQTGDVPDITNADVINYLLVTPLSDGNGNNFYCIRPNGIDMTVDQFEIALNLIANINENNLFTVGKTYDHKSWSETAYMSTSDIRSILYAHDSKGNDILQGSGMEFFFGFKYTVGHFIGIGGRNIGGEAEIIDTMGPLIHGQRSGLVKYLGLAGRGGYFDDINGQPGIFSAFTLLFNF